MKHILSVLFLVTAVAFGSESVATKDGSIVTALVDAAPGQVYAVLSDVDFAVGKKGSPVSDVRVVSEAGGVTVAVYSVRVPLAGVFQVTLKHKNARTARGFRSTWEVVAPDCAKGFSGEVVGTAVGDDTRIVSTSHFPDIKVIGGEFLARKIAQKNIDALADGLAGMPVVATAANSKRQRRL